MGRPLSNRARAGLIAVALLLLGGCKGKSTEMRAREQIEKMKASLPDIEAKALEQTVTSAEVREAQEALKAADEYLGEINGKLDAVTVNSIEAFQRAHGLKDNGLLNKKTKRLLRETLARQPAKG
jgi:peptidoglycan hydrolase-like protein with peptidoglycan-binding domain